MSPAIRTPVMRKKRKEPATLENVLTHFSNRLKFFKGSSRKSYQKAFSSFQVYAVSNYRLSSLFKPALVENWMVHNIMSGLSYKTVSFYLDKLASLYSATAFHLESGRTDMFRQIKKNFKIIESDRIDPELIIARADRIKEKWQKSGEELNKSKLLHDLLHFPSLETENETEPDSKIANLWGCVALAADVPADIVKGILGKNANEFPILSICSDKIIEPQDRELAIKNVSEFLHGEKPQWFAMHLRPKANYEQLLNRFSLISQTQKIPELFYPSEEIIRQVGRKIEWKDKPVIRSVVFFRHYKSRIYSLFSCIYDLAWCYRLPGAGCCKYAAIPDKVMEDFKKALGFITPDFEVAPSGQLELKPGDEVVIVTGDYVDEKGTIIKKPSLDEDGNKIYRVSLLNSNGHWDIGIDARLLKKV